MALLGQSNLIVTHTDGDGISDYEQYVLDEVTEYDDDKNPLFSGKRMWGTPDGISIIGPGHLPANVQEPWFPGAGGVRFLVFSFLPKANGAGDLAKSKSGGLADTFDQERPGMHISDTVDFVYVLSGAMYLELDRRDVLVKQGDAIIQRGTWHGWRVESDEPCTVVCILMGARREGDAAPTP